MKFNDWKKYFKTLDKEKLSKLEDALIVLLDDEAIAREFKGIGLLDLKYLAGCELLERK